MSAKQPSARLMMQKARYFLDPALFIKEVLGYQVEPCHQAILQHITTAKKTLDLAPRGFGKSTVGDIGYCLWKIVQDRNIRILVVSNTQSQAEAFLREMKYHLTSNSLLTGMYGQFKSDKWTESELIVTERTISAKEATVTALGASGAVISKHFDLIIADDVVDFESARTELQRKRLSEWYRTSLLPCLEPHGELRVLGTRYHPLDLYQGVIDSGQYAVQIQSAISPDNKSLWAEKFTIQFLRDKQAELGSIIFDMQYMNDISLARQGKIFRYDWFSFYSPESLTPQVTGQMKMKIYQGVDLAISKSETADYFVIMTIGITQYKDIYILDMFRDRISFNQQIEIIKRKAEQWQPISIGIESNAYQAALPQSLISTTHLPIKELVTVKDKVTRGQKRSALFENRKVYMKKDMTIMMDELCLFPDAAHDDTFDAFDLAVTVADRLDPNRFKVNARQMTTSSSSASGN